MSVTFGPLLSRHSEARTHFQSTKDCFAPMPYRLTKHTTYPARSGSFVFALHSQADPSASVLAPASSCL